MLPVVTRSSRATLDYRCIYFLKRKWKVLLFIWDVENTFLCTWVILFKRRHTLFALRSTVSADVGSAAYQVKGDEGLLDTGRMEKAFLGSGVKVPKDKQLK